MLPGDSCSPEIATRQSTALIPRYKVIFFNDEITTFEFVIAVLHAFFNKSIDEAKAVAHSIHTNGSGIAGIYPLEVAELKQQQTVDNARQYDYPLKVTLEAV